jgi:hypothetical protein
LSRRGVPLLGEAFQQINNGHIRGDAFRREALETGSEVRLRVELRASIDLPGQIAHSERAPWYETDSERLAGCKDAVPFGTSLHERVFTLNRGNRLHRMRSANCASASLGEAEVQNLSRSDQIFDSTSDILDRHFLIDAVLIVEIDRSLLRRLSDPSTLS